MSTVYNDIMDSLNELLDAAQGKETGIVVHPRTVKEVESFSPQQIKQIRALLKTWVFTCKEVFSLWTNSYHTRSSPKSSGEK